METTYTIFYWWTKREDELPQDFAPGVSKEHALHYAKALAGGGYGVSLWARVPGEPITELYYATPS